MNYAVIVLAVLVSVISMSMFLKARSAESEQVVRDCSAPGEFVSRHFVDKSINRGTDNEIDRSWFVYKYKFECCGQVHYAERTSPYGLRNYKKATVKWPSGHPEKAIVELEAQGSSDQILLCLVILMFTIGMYLLNSGLLYKWLGINGN